MKAVEIMDIDAVTRILILAGANLKLKNRQGKTARNIAVRLGIANVFLSDKIGYGKPFVLFSFD